MKFRFEAFDRAGNLIEDDVEAADADEASRVILARGITPYDVRISGGADFLFREVSLDGGQWRFGDAQLARLARDLAVLLQAGLPLDAALRITSTITEKSHTRALVLNLMEGVLQGSSLADAMAGMGKTFQPEFVRVVEAGELGADLGGAMLELAELLDRRVEIRNRIRSAMTYPALLLGLAAISIAIVLGLLVPAVTPLFLENGMPLPAILGAMETIRQNASLILAVAGAGLAALAFGIALARRNVASRIRLDRLYLSVPIVGRISQLREAGRFTRTLSTLIKAGVPPLQAFQASCPLVRNHHIRSRLEHSLSEIRAGVSIGNALSMADALPVVVQQMVTVGEESGRLQDMLARAALILERQEQLRTARALAALTPAITILVASMIAVIILSVMGAVLSINELALL